MLVIMGKLFINNIFIFNMEIVNVEYVSPVLNKNRIKAI